MGVGETVDLTVERDAEAQLSILDPVGTAFEEVAE